MQNFGHNRRRTDEIRVEYFPRIHYIGAWSVEVQKFMGKMSEPEQFQGRIIFTPMLMTSYGEIQTMKRNVLLIPHLCLYLQKDFQQDVGHSSDLGQNQSGILLTDRPQGELDSVAELMIRFGESGHPVFRATSPFSRGTLTSKGGGKLSIHFSADGDTIETVFRTIISVNQLSIYGAVSDLCEEYSACQTRTVRPVLAGQSEPLFAPEKLLIMTPTPSIEIPAQENLLQKHKELVENRSIDKDLY